MITEKTISAIANIHTCIVSRQSDVVKQQIYAIDNDAEEIAENLLNEDMLPSNKRGVQYIEMLSWFIELCSYVENEMEIPAIISDELYDKLVERLINMGGVHQIGSPTSNIIGMTDRQHEFPELRGSLAKVHFLWEKDVPEKDSRKSLEWFLNNVVRQMAATGLRIGEIPISVDIKYDGVSHIIEGHGDEFDHVLTRGDVLNNMGKDLTPLFSRFFPDQTGLDREGVIGAQDMVDMMNLNMVPENLWYHSDDKFGIKVETWMPTDKFEDFKKDFGVKRCNRRSAVTSICNQAPDYTKPDREYFKFVKYLRMRHFQIATTAPIDFSDDESPEKNYWYPIGKLNGHFNYIYVEFPDTIDLRNINECITALGESISAVKETARIMNIPCDGAVITILDQDIINLLGRKDDKNMFQVAFKFPAGEEVTTIEGVDFQVGPIAGRITPVARLKPIVINGNTISNVTVSNADKLNRLRLHIGDEVLIRYDIIPSIFKPASCKETDNDLITFPTTCPICGGAIVDEVCSNYDCPAKTVGHVLNFVDRVNIKGGIGLETIELLVDEGFLTNIGDLYRLVYHRDELCKLPRLGETSVDNILAGISAARQLYPHQILGSIGIPNIGLKTMEKICRKINILGNLDYLEEYAPQMWNIPGIGQKTAVMVIAGIQRKMPLIEDICRNVEVLSYQPEPTYIAHVCFTDVTLPEGDDFKEFLKSKGIKEHESFTKSGVEYLIIPDVPPEKPTVKMKNAKKWGTPMLTVSEAKEKWGYEKQ